MHFAGELTGSELARRLGLRFTAIEPAVHALKAQHQIEIVGGTMVGPASYRYRITDSGRARVTIFLEHNQYVGVAPVPLAHYVAYLQRLEEGGAAHRDAQPPSRGLSASRARAARARSARPGDQCRPLAVRLRPARQRQVGDLAGDSQPARRRHRDSARAGGRGADRPAVRPRQPRRAPARRRRRARRRRGGRTGAGCAAGGRS